MKNEELLVKRALSGDRNLESIKKINLGVLRKELSLVLNKISNSC